MWPVIILLFVASFPTSTPLPICDSLLPLYGNGIPPLTTISPFSLKLSTTIVSPGQTISVEIQTVRPELKIGGFMVQARTSSPPYEIIGTFTSSFDGLKLINCDGANNTAMYYLLPSSGYNMEVLQWQAPNDYSGEVVFKATIAEADDAFWVGIESAPVKVAATADLPIAFDYTSAIEAKQQTDSSIYEGCGTRKTCFGLPNNCVEEQSCQAIVTAVVLNGRYQFELQSSVSNVGYVALGLSDNDRMGSDSVMECIPEEGIIRAYTSWNNPRGNTREGVPQNIISLLSSSYNDGTIYCKLEREAITTVLETEFDLVNNNFHFLVAIGTTVTASSITRHDIARIASTEPLDIIQQRFHYPIYEGCGETKTCFGLPNNCVEEQSCQAIVTAVVLNGRYQFELQSSVSNVGYVALGLSDNDRMGSDSVMECIPEEGIIRAYTSWNNPRGNTREGVPQNIISLLSSSYNDGTIYCKLEREAITTVLETEFDLVNNNFHFLVAIGTTVTASSITRHDIARIASTEPLDIIEQRIYDPIYEGCGETKTCFGLPNNCVEERSCQAVATAVFIDGRYQFELKSSVSNVAYVALGLSVDDRMGNDSVMECIPEGGFIRAYSSWNEQRGNTREGVPQDIITLLSASYEDGAIYCKLERQAVSTVLESEFDLVNDNFHFLVAIGTTVSASSISYHDLGRIASAEPFDLGGENDTGNGFIANKLSIISLTIWFIASKLVL